MAFYCTPIREHDSDGNLTEAGAKWSEGDHSTVGNIGNFLAGMFFAAFILLIGWGLTYANGMIGAVVILGGLGYGGFMIWAMAVGGAPRHRLIIFKRNNQTEWRQGDKVLHFPKFRPDNITSIQYRRDQLDKNPDLNPNFPKSHVIFLNDDGDVNIMARDLHEDSAIKITAQLQKALAEMQAAMVATYKMDGDTLHVTIGMDDVDPLERK